MQDVELPEVGALKYLVGYLAEVGEAQQTGEGIIATGWQDLKAWMELTGIRLTPFEALTLRRLSICYVSQFYRSEGVDCAPPVKQESYIETVDRKLMQMFKTLKEARHE